MAIELEDTNKELLMLFSRAPLKSQSGHTYEVDNKKAQHEEELLPISRRGIRNFKRSLLGLCGKQTVKTADGIINALIDLEVARNYTHGEEILQKISGKKLFYRIDGVPETWSHACSLSVVLEPLKNEGPKSFAVTKVEEYTGPGSEVYRQKYPNRGGCAMESAFDGGSILTPYEEHCF